METFIVVAIALIVVLFILRFVFKAAKGIITLGIGIILLGVGLHYFAPETLDKFLGAERHQRWTKEITAKMDTVTDETGKKSKEWLDNVEKTK